MDFKNIYYQQLDGEELLGGGILLPVGKPISVLFCFVFNAAAWKFVLKKNN